MTSTNRRVINNEFVRRPLERELFDQAAGELQLGAKMDPKKDFGGDTGISKRAADEARKALLGYRNNGNDADAYVVTLGGKKHILIDSRTDRENPGMGMSSQGHEFFQVLSPKSGQVVARGRVEDGPNGAQIVYTVGKNGTTSTQPTEINDVGRKRARVGRGESEGARPAAKMPTVAGAVAFAKAVRGEMVAGLEDGTAPHDGLFSVVYPNDGSSFVRKSDAEAAARAVRGKGFDSYVTKDGPHKYSIVINN